MKTYLAAVLLLVASAAMPIWAQRPGMAKQKAQPLLEKHFSRSINAGQLSEVQLPLSVADSPLKAYNIDGGGFALVHYGDDADGEPVLIGYSDRGTFSEEAMPDPLRQWIQDIAAQPSAAAQAPFHYDYTPVAPLLRTQWGQREPFNGQCPTYNDVPTPAGCTAVALAQVLYYYQSGNTSQVLEQYVNTATSTEITVDYSRGRYDWANMLPVYEEDSYTSQQADAVARLMFEAGVACHCQYGDIATSGSVPFVALQRHFDFECNYYYRPFVTTEMWMDVIQQNLLEGRPVIYSGGSGGVGSVNVSGHSFIVDGIDASGFCHVNWGWAGLDDGYYNIAFCNPPSADRGFVSQQSMITDIRPRTAGEHYEERLVQAGTILNQSYSAVTTNSYDKRNYDVTCGLIPVDAATTLANVQYNMGGAALTNLAFPTIHIKGSNGAVVGGGSYTYPLSDGTYKLSLYYGDSSDDASWCMAQWPEKFMSTVRLLDGKIVIDDSSDSTYLHELQPLSDACTGSYFYVKLDVESAKTVRGNSSYVSSLPKMTFQNVETGVKYDYPGVYTPCYYPGVRYEKVLRMKPTNPDNGFSMPVGTYRFLFGEPNARWANATDHDHLITIAPKPDYPLLDVNQDEARVLQKNVYYDYDVPVFFPQHLYSANNVGGKVVMNVYATREGEDEEFFVCSIPDYQVNANSESVLNYDCTLPVNLYPLMGSYRFTYRYLTPDGERSLLSPLALSQRVFVWRTSGYGYIHTLQAASQLETSPAPSEGGEGLAGRNSLIGKSYSGRSSPLSEGSGEVLSLQVRNCGSRKFEGTITATFINTATGDFLKAESEPVVIASGEEAVAVFREALPSLGGVGGGSYDVYFDGLAEGSSTAVAVLRDDLQLRAHQTFTVGTSGIEPMRINHSSELKTQNTPVYDLCGRKLSTLNSPLTTLPKGVYIVNGKKIVIP